MSLVRTLCIALAGSCIAATADDPPRAAEQQAVATRAAVQNLMTHLDDFVLRLAYEGPNRADNPSLWLCVTMPRSDMPSDYRVIVITRERAALLVGYLAADGLLYRGTVNAEKGREHPPEPYHHITAMAGGTEYSEYLTWGDAPTRWHGIERPPLAQQLEALRVVLDGEAATALDAVRAAYAKRSR